MRSSFVGIYLLKYFQNQEVLHMNINARSAGPPSYSLLGSRSPVSCNSEKTRFSDAPHAPASRKAPLPLPISFASRISAAAPFFKNPLAGRR